ncbi:BlaI/MecI/CopY family transcriptional regulator [Sphingomonas abietis]|uniref:BlaI/MecI/CopY family transcriptional regulator n=1 Tax=Sphingomonas abietis TaxID=3012344 RepID=A0ABY7NJC7_9SPHN|nr:BlaI/MecI/CopY family transcriptional regulator [Sphingomonas abietis]WBO21626.1 BlaI/MecI/CopY family transcriptional regulator [Sphingomonas abietis]
MAERIGEAELSVMDVLWASAVPLTALEVAERIHPVRDWSDRTVKTMLARLLAKGVLAHEEDGRRYLYRAMVTRNAYVARESRRLVDRLFGGRAAPLLAHLAENDGLTTQDIAELETLLKTLRR